MMPTIAASTGARLPAERLARRAPLEHDQHLLVHAGADAVDRQQRRAARRVVEFSGCTSSSFAPSNFRCFCVETTVPMTRAICIC